MISFDYAVLRVVPRVDREEFINAGIILFCLKRDFLQARVHLDFSRLLALCPGADAEVIASHLASVPKICAGSGPIGQLAIKERWHWLISPRSTLVQPGPVHSGLCEDPAIAIEKLMARVVR